jgi:hypothetical protein
MRSFGNAKNADRSTGKVPTGKESGENLKTQEKFWRTLKKTEAKVDRLLRS